MALSLLLAMPVQVGGYAVQVASDEQERVAFVTDPTRSADTLPPEQELMTDNYDQAPTTPEDYTSLWSAMTYHWMGGMMKLATRRTLRPDDIWRMRTINDTALLYSKYSRLLPKAPSGAGLLGRLVRLSAYDATLDLLWKVGGVALNYAGPALSKRILECIEQDHSPNRPTEKGWTPRSEAFAWAMCALLVGVVRQVAELINFHQARQVGMRIRQVLTVELFNKTLRAKVVLVPPKSEIATPTADSTPAATPTTGSDTGSVHSNESDESALSGTQATDGAGQLAGTDVGLVTNMMATDINNLLRMGCDLHNLYGAPIEIIIASLFLYSLLGYSALAGIAVLATSVPINYYAGQYLKHLTQDYQAKRDRRIALETELFRAIKYIKAQGLDALWESRVRRARNTELWGLAKCRIVNAAITVYWAGVPLLTALLAFSLYTVIFRNHLTIPVAFTSVSLFALLKAPLQVLPTFMTLFIQAWVSIRRLETYLSEAEVSPVPDVVPNGNGKQAPPTVQIQDAVFSWPKSATVQEFRFFDAPTFQLQVPELTLPSRGLCVVEGKTASGKSALLLAILGELDQQGILRRTPHVSYQSQSAWLEGGSSVRTNILFGSAYDPKRYAEAVAASALDMDLADKDTFPQGDATRISVQTLSGGQRARLVLARALYAPNARLILLDDCLSAVDAHIQRRIVKKALLGPLGAGSADRLVVIATHHAHLLRDHANVIVRIDHGRVSTTYQTPSVPAKISSLNESNGALKEQEFNPKTSDRNGEATPAQPADELLYQNEKRREGVASWSALNGYIVASGYLIWFAFTFVTGLQRVFDLGESIWVREWGEKGPASTSPRHGDRFYLAGYAVILVLGILGCAGRYVYIYIASQKASRAMHRYLLRAVLAAIPRWHDSVPVGRLINLFSADMNVVDQELPNAVSSICLTAVWVLGSLIVILAFVPTFLIPVALLVAVGPRYVAGFIAAMRDMQRVQSIVASPIYTFFGQVMAGSPTIRAFGQQGRLSADMIHLTSAFMSNWWAVCSMEVWLQVRVGALGAVSVWVVTLLCLGSRSIDSGAAGIALSVASTMPNLLYQFLRNYQQMINQTNSLERIETCSQAPPETLATALPPPEPSPDWPAFGRIELRDVWARYDSHLPFVLKGIGLIAEPGSKVGILGRSGSGKSSTVSTLLRLLPIERGTISIDGIDIQHVPLPTLRRRIAVCPQEPVLFSGTVRDNVDPLRRATDAAAIQVLTTLERGISQAVPTALEAEEGENEVLDHLHHLQLDDAVAAGGQNLSAGQRQVISLARALLSRPKVLLLDEATADTDHLTDAKIQQVLEQLEGCTVLTVAHRLRTVITYDTVHIMANGSIVESGAPVKLLQDTSSRLAQMCDAAGSSEAQELRQLAGLKASTRAP